MLSQEKAAQVTQRTQKVPDCPSSARIAFTHVERTFTYEDARVTNNTVASDVQLICPLHDALPLRWASYVVKPANKQVRTLLSAGVSCEENCNTCE